MPAPVSLRVMAISPLPLSCADRVMLPPVVALAEAMHQAVLDQVLQRLVSGPG
jgi:hypothetical protein